MKPYKERKFHLCGMRSRTEFAPADLMRGVERERSRFLRNLHIDISPWQIAKIMSRTLRGSHGEGLRGLFVPNEGEHGRIYWWAAHHGSHHQGRLMLNVERDRLSQNILEVETNAHPDGSLYFQFGLMAEHAPDHTQKFLKHPSLGELKDGCLSLNGRYIVINDQGQIKLASNELTKIQDIKAKKVLRLQILEQMIADATKLARSRSKFLPDGSPFPNRETLSTYRLWLANELLTHGSYIKLPTVEIQSDTITVTWRGPDAVATITFHGHMVRKRSVIFGRCREAAPIEIKTARQMWRKSPTLPESYLFRSAEEPPR